MGRGGTSSTGTPKLALGASDAGLALPGVKYSQQILEAVLATAPGFIAAIDPDGRILFINRVLPELDPEEVIGSSVFDYIAPDDRAVARDCFARVIRTREPGAYETRGLGPAGAQTYYQTTVGPVIVDDEVVALTLLSTDIAEQKRTELALRDSEQKLRLAIEATEMGIWSWDSVTDVVRWDEVMCRHFRVEPEQAPTTYVGYRDLVYPPDRAAVVESIGRALETGSYEDIEHRIQLADGEIRWLLIKGAVIRDDSGAVTGLLGGVFDITERRRFDERLRRGQKMEAVGQLAAGVAHNFNNMLTGVLTNLQLVARKAPAELSPAVADATDAARRAADVVAQLVELAGHSGDRTRETVDLVEVAQRVVSMCKTMFDKTVAIELEPRVAEAAVTVNVSHVEQALLNLCLNARDAVVAAEVADPRIRVTIDEVSAEAPELSAIPVRRGSSHVCVRVSDNGIGIDPATRDRIFEPFFTTKHGGGSGLGLATAHATAVEHGGWLDCDSVRGRGTTFVLYLPEAEAEAEPVAAPPTGRAPSGAGTVLLVDDEEIVRNAIARLLEEGGYRVVQAPDGARALELFEAQGDEIDVVLLDQSMPGLSGRAVLERLVAIDPDVRVVMFTGYAAEEREYPRATAILGKPVDEQRLFGTLTRVIGQR